MKKWLSPRILLALTSLLPFHAHSQNISQTIDPKAAVVSMVAHEDEAERHRDHYIYLSEERSERTGGHLWRERVAETNAGKIHKLLAVDGVSLTPDQLARERSRLAAIAQDPESFARREQTRKDDEAHAKEMLELLPKAFIFSNPQYEGHFLHLEMRPDPAYQPQSMEERVLQHMQGSIVIEMNKMRLRELSGALPEDVSIAFGLLATIKSGSHFATSRMNVYGDEWKTQTIQTDIQGRAIFFKTIGKKQFAEHSDFHLIAHEMTVPEAVALLEA